MPEEVDPVSTLATAAERLIEERRAMAVTIALGYRRRRTDDIHTSETRDAFIAIQSLIEAIDRALTHEKLIMSRQPASFAVPVSETAPSTTPRLDSRQ
jgi:hypothetical protein